MKAKPIFTIAFIMMFSIVSNVYGYDKIKGYGGAEIIGYKELRHTGIVKKVEHLRGDSGGVLSSGSIRYTIVFFEDGYVVPLAGLPHVWIGKEHQLYYTPDGLRILIVK